MDVICNRVVSFPYYGRNFGFNWKRMTCSAEHLYLMITIFFYWIYFMYIYLHIFYCLTIWKYLILFTLFSHHKIDYLFKVLWVSLLFHRRNFPRFLLIWSTAINGRCVQLRNENYYKIPVHFGITGYHGMAFNINQTSKQTRGHVEHLFSIKWLEDCRVDW